MGREAPAAFRNNEGAIDFPPIAPTMNFVAAQQKAFGLRRVALQ
jgi:hypothetical protein